MNKITQTIKPLFLFFTLATLLQVQAQQYVNGPLSTGAISNSGVAAPPGTTWSELQNDAGNLTVTNTEEGFWIGNVFRNKLADDFVVPAGQLWDIHNFEFYVYKTDITFTTLPVTSLGIEIWNGDPALGTSTKLFGDLAADVLDLPNCVPAMMYSIENSNFAWPNGDVPNLSKKIWKIRGTFNASLTPGTYWVVFQPVNPSSGNVYAAIKRIAGSRGYAQGNAGKYFDGSPGGVWYDTLDYGAPIFAGQAIPQDFTFNINYDLTLSNHQISALENLKIYPNPAKDVIKLDWADLSGITTFKSIAITDIRGVIVMKNEINPTSSDTNAEMNLSSLQGGVYIMQLIDTENRVFNRKIIKE